MGHWMDPVTSSTPSWAALYLYVSEPCFNARVSAEPSNARSKRAVSPGRYSTAFKAPDGGIRRSTAGSPTLSPSA
jgi:hypothetical protein